MSREIGHRRFTICAAGIRRCAVCTDPATFMLKCTRLVQDCGERKREREVSLCAQCVRRFAAREELADE